MDKRYDLRASLNNNGRPLSIDLWRDGEYYVAEIKSDSENLIVVGSTTKSIGRFLETAAEAFRKAQE
ncbi:MAG: hypothetical protein ACYTFW_00430 [Planctomycetota bacterium]|jgi:hypothetical protein